MQKIKDLIKEIKLGGTINQILINLKLDNSGGNYKRIYEICKKNQLIIPKKLTLKPKSHIENKKEKIQNKLSNIQEKINLIVNSNINFDKRGWTLKVAEILKISPQAVKQWMIREMPEFYKNCWHHDN